MRRQRRGFKLLALLLGLSLFAASCGGDDDDKAADTGDATEEDLPTGGELVLGAEQWPECLNPITQCSNASWLTWTVLHHVLPKLMEVDPDGNFVPTPVIDGEPELSGEGTDNGDGPFTVTYNIAEDAQWDDGTPITSTDLKFTLETRMATTGVVTTYGYEDIESVDDSDPKVAVIEWKRPFADWQDVFGGGTEFFIKAEAFEGTTDIANEMQDEIPFSGGPWVLESWSTEESHLVRNENYWADERMPLADSITFIPMEDTETEITSLRSGTVMGLFPQPGPDTIEALGDLDYQVGYGVTYENLWFNLSSQLNTDSVMNDPAVREALLFAINRDAILEEVIHPGFPDTELNPCPVWVPTVGEWCDAADFEDVTYDPDHAADVLEEAGYAKGSDGIYAKDGKRLALTWQTVAGNQRREDIQGLIIPQLQEFGIEVTTDNYDAGTLFEQKLPQMQTELALYAQVTSPDPSVTTILACDNIPTAANEFSGQNNSGWCNEEATALMRESDETVLAEDRLALIQQINDFIREDAVILPLYQLPLITAWDSSLIGGPVGAYTTTPQGGFGNVYDWAVL